MKKNPLLGLGALGQSIWIDFIHRGMFERLIGEDGVKGVTSNPAIFEKAIAGTHEYDDEIRAMAAAGKSAGEIYDALTIEDVQMSADLFRGLYDRLEGKDGFMSLEVSPLLAHDTDGTVSEAHRLWKAIDRPNAFIKGDHGDPSFRLGTGLDEARAALGQLPALGIDLAEISQQDDGVAKFTDAYARLMAALVERRAKDLAEVGKR